MGLIFFLYWVLIVPFEKGIMYYTVKGDADLLVVRSNDTKTTRVILT